jgi:hypothetical protein
VEYAPIFPEFDPELHPIGYALAVELLEDDAGAARTADRSAIQAKGEVDRFGWEFEAA